MKKKYYDAGNMGSIYLLVVFIIWFIIGMELTETIQIQGFSFLGINILFLFFDLNDVFPPLYPCIDMLKLIFLPCYSPIMPSLL